MKFFETIASFFTETIPEFVQSHSLLITTVLLIVLLALIVVLIVVSIRSGRDKARNKSLLESWINKNSERVKEIEKGREDYKALNDKYIDVLAKNKNFEDTAKLNEEKLTKDLDTCKELVAEREMEIAALTKSDQDKSNKIAEMTIEKDSMIKKITEQESTIVLLKEECDSNSRLISQACEVLKEINTTKEEREAELKDTRLAYSELEKSFVGVKTELSEVSEKYEEALKEIDVLKNYKLENEILLKTLRKFKDDDFEEKSELTFRLEELEKLVRDSLSTKCCHCETEGSDYLETLKRSQLSEIAKQIGLTNFATWTNEKLRDEIRKYKS